MYYIITKLLVIKLWRALGATFSHKRIQMLPMKPKNQQAELQRTQKQAMALENKREIINTFPHVL